MRFLRLLVLVVLLPLIPVIAVAGTPVSGFPRRPPSGMAPGVVFKAPEATDAGNHERLKSAREVRGAEIYLNWSDIEAEEGVYDWSVIDRWAEYYDGLGKRIAVSVASASFAINDSPAWLFNRYDVRRVAKGYWLNFENGNRDYQLRGDRVAEPVVLSTGTAALRARRPDAIRSDPAKHPLASANGYSIQFDYRMETDGRLVARILSDAGSVVRAAWSWPLSAGDRGVRTVEWIPPAGVSDAVVEIGTESGSALLDNLNIVEMRSGFFVGNLTFPNYFDPVFFDRYGAFVRAFADRYRDDPRVAIVYVGGFGRWDELTLCNDTDLAALEDQWTTYGYTDARYLAHVEACADLYLEAFGEKPLMMTIAGFRGADTFRDQNLLDWRVSAMAARKGILLKYNGWQEKCTEWNSEGNAIYYTLYRHRFDGPGIILEQGAQVNNTMSEIMGHPISMFNKAIGYGADFFWMYSNDLVDRYVSRNLHYANESAGGVLNTRLFALMMKTDYVSPHTGQAYVHRNVTWQVYQSRRRGGESEDVTVDGVMAARTGPDNARIHLSVDDRIMVDGMYSPVLQAEFLDQGTDTLTFYARQPTGQEEVLTWQKKDTGAWVTLYLDARPFVETWKGGSSDIFDEIILDDRGDGPETLRGIELDYVPAGDFRTRILAAREPAPGERLDLAATVVFTVDNPALDPVSALSIPLMGSVEPAPCTAMVTVEADDGNGGFRPLVRKECHMPEDLLWYGIPLAGFPRADRYRVTLEATRGSVGVAAAGGEPAFRLLSWETDPAVPVALGADGTFRADLPFAALLLPADTSGSDGLRLERVFPDGTVLPVVPTARTQREDGLAAWFEPVTAGRYRLAGATPASLSLVPLSRIRPPSAPTREITGDLHPAFQGLEWTLAPAGFVEVRPETGGFSASVSGRGPWLETGAPLSLEADSLHYFHFVLKNGTASSLARLYWKTDGTDYSELNSILVPVVANDTEYREYCYAIGSDLRYRRSGAITGFRFVPAVGDLQGGRLTALAMELRTGHKAGYAVLEPLDPAAVVLSTSVRVPATPTDPAASPTPSPTAGGGGNAIPLPFLAVLGALVLLAAGGLFLLFYRIGRTGRASM